MNKIQTDPLHRTETIHAVPYEHDRGGFDLELECWNGERYMIITRPDGTRYPMRKAEFEAMGWTEGTLESLEEKDQRIAWLSNALQYYENACRKCGEFQNSCRCDYGDEG